MNRRNALHNVAILLGGAFSAPTLLAMNTLDATGTNNVRTTFELDAFQRQIVAKVAEMIIPKTDTPGAIEAGVPDFIEMMLKDCYLQPEHQSFLEGVNTLQQQGFLAKSISQQTDLLKNVELETKELMISYNVQQSKMGDNEDKELMNYQKKGLPFWRLMKELTLIGYFTSEVGINSNFKYAPIPGKFELIKLKPNQKLFAY